MNFRGANAESLNHIASQASTQSQQINSNYNQLFFEWLSSQPAPHSQGPMGSSSAESLLVHNPSLATEYAQSFAEQTIQSTLQSQGISQPQISKQFTANNQMIAGQAAVSDFHQNFQNQVRHIGALSQNSLNHNITHQAKYFIAKSQGKIREQMKEVGQSGVGLQREVVRWGSTLL